MTPRRTLRLSPLLLCALSLDVAAEEEISGPAPTESVLDGSALAERALEHFRAGRHAAAVDDYDDAAELLAGEDWANARFNAAVAVFALGRYANAEERFLALAASAGAPLDSLCRVHAGFAALRQGALERAKGHTSDLPAASDPEVRRRRIELGQLIAELEADRERRAFLRDFEAGLDALERGFAGRARKSLLQALGRQRLASPEERVELHYALSVLSHEGGDLSSARSHLENALTLSPQDPELHLALAELLRDLRDPSGAERHFEFALAGSPRTRERAEEGLSALSPLPSPGTHGWMGAGAGYDQNALQSGTADTLGLSGAGLDQGSAFMSLGVEVEHQRRAGRRTTFGGYYGGDALLLLAPNARDLSLQAHELGWRSHHALGFDASLRLSLAGALLLSGLDTISPLTAELSHGARLELRRSFGGTTRLDYELRPMRGLSDREYLSGLRAEVGTAQRWTPQSWRLQIGARLRYNGIGTQSWSVDPALFPDCTRCDVLRHQVPLGFWAPQVSVEVGRDLLAGWHVALSGRFEHRRYLEASFITGVPGSEKVRLDDRWRAAVGTSYDMSSNVRLSIDSSLLISRSNMAFDPSDPEHRFDYDDRNFVQHVVELGASVVF